MPSFDIVSKTDLSEVDNAINGMRREIETRFDFKGSKCSIERKDELLTMLADDDLKLKQMQELLKGYITRRKLDAGALDFKPPEKASGNTLRQVVQVKQGIEQTLAKDIVRSIKDSKIKGAGLDPGRRAARLRQEARRSADGDPACAGDEDRAAAAICEFPRLVYLDNGRMTP